MNASPPIGRFLLIVSAISLPALLQPDQAEAAEPLRLAAPLPHSVAQRQGLLLRKATGHEPAGAQRGQAKVAVEFDLADRFPTQGELTAEYRIVALANAWGDSTSWATLPGKATDRHWNGVAAIEAGGWYRLEVRLRNGETELAAGAVEPIGVGEVFLIAGQSYATNSNDELLKPTEPAGRVVAFDASTKSWRTADDPQPTADRSNHGSIWPPLGDTLAGVLQVPIAFVNVAAGGTASVEWLPGTGLCNGLIAAGKLPGSFRCVLWQQGESDVLAKTSTETYVRNLVAIHTACDQAWGAENTVWLLAKSTLHPTVYNDPDGEARIRAAIDQLCVKPGFHPGPDTDLLDGENRGPLGTMRHFSPIGQRRAATLWFAAIWQELNRGP